MSGAVRKKNIELSTRWQNHVYIHHHAVPTDQPEGTMSEVKLVNKVGRPPSYLPNYYRSRQWCCNTEV